VSEWRLRKTSVARQPLGVATEAKGVFQGRRRGMGYGRKVSDVGDVCRSTSY
jgi:hypothetical protein